jgi:predicted metalloprotease
MRERNAAMQWRGRRTSSNVEDRRRGGMGRPAGIGGIGLVVVVLIGLFFGVDVTPLLTGGGGGFVETSSPSGPNEIDDEIEEFVAVVLADTEDAWGGMFEESNLSYEQPRLVLFPGRTSSACGAAQSAMGPFYCPNDQTIYLDTSFFQQMQQFGAANGDFARAYVIAHEVGHHVQHQLGVLGQVHRARSQMGEAESNALSVRVELQADCYSGVWARTVSERLQLTDQDIRDALRTAAAIGDDALQRSSQGVVVPDSFTHGTSEQRQTWFYRGFESGNPDDCDTFAAAL